MGNQANNILVFMFSMFKNILSLFQSRKQPKMTKTNTSELQSGTIFVQDCSSGEVSDLYQLDLETGKAELVGAITNDVYDIAFVDSQLFGIDQEENSDTTRLVKIDPATGEVSVVGDIGYYVVGLAYNQQRNTLYASAAKQIIAIDLETGRGQAVIKFSRSKRVCGEITFDQAGTAYITLIGSDRKKFLASCDLDTKKIKIIGDTGFPDLASMEFVGDVLYGVTGNFFDLGKDGQLISIDTSTGKGSLLTTTDPLGRWAGMTIYEPAIETAKTAKTTTTTNSTDEQSEIQKEEQEMKQLVINTKENCYVIEPDGMNELQQNVASSFTCEAGTYELQISGGSYSYSNSNSVLEPSLLLWIYGVDGSTFINQNVGLETGATWTTLNGYSDKLTLEVKEQTVVCALLFDTKNRERQGAINLAINSDIESFETQQITVDSNSNCYVLDESYLNRVKQWDTNFIELDPGDYKIKIRESDANYWSENQQLDLDPWALIWLKAGKFISSLTGIEAKEAWCSLNGLQDEFILEVKEKTTLSGLFFDTYKEDNQGQIILSIEPIGTTELAQLYQQQGSNTSRQTTTIIGGSTSSTSSTTVTTTSGSTSTEVGVGVGVSQGGGWQGSNSFSFRFDETQMEEMWQQMAAKIETSVTVTDEQDEGKEAQYWDNLEKWILKGYQSQAKELGMQVARLEFMMKSITQQMEVSFNQNFQGWSSHFDERLNNLLATRITSMVDEQVNHKLSQQTQDIKQMVVDQMQSEVDQRIDTIVNLKVANLSQEIKNNSLEQIEVDLDKRIANKVNINISDRSTDINDGIIAQIQNEMDERINNVVNLKINDQTQEIKRLTIEQIQSDLDNRINAVVNLKTTDLASELNSLIVQQIQGDIDGRINNVVNLKVGNLGQEIKKSSLDLVTADIEQIKTELDNRIANTINVNLDERSSEINNTVIENIQNEMDERINNVVNLRISDRSQEIKRQAIEQIQGDLDKRIDALISLKTTDLSSELNSLIVQQIQGDIDGRINNVVNLKVGNLGQEIKNSSLDLVTADIEQIKTELDNRIANTINVNLDERSSEINNTVIENIQNEMDERINNVVNLRISDQGQEIKRLVFEQIQADLEKRIAAVVNLQITDFTPELNSLIVQQIQGNIDQRIDAVVNLKTSDLTQNLKNLIIQQLQPDIDRQITAIVDRSTDNNVQVVVNNIMGDIDNRINVNFDNKILNFRDDVTSIVRNEINDNNEAITNTILADITNQQFFVDVRSIKAEVENFYNRLGQFETQLDMRIKQGDTQLYNWTLEQLVALQGCLTDRQSLVDMFESFASNLKDELDNAPCVQPSRFKPMTATIEQSQLYSAQPGQLPGS